MKNKVVIITSKDDIHADSVIRHIQDNEAFIGTYVIRINTEDFALNSQVVFDGDHVSIKLNDSGKSIISNEIYSVWYRRPKPIRSNHKDKEVQSFVSAEWNSFLRGFYFCTHDTAKWVNPLPSLHRAKIKLQQIQLALRLQLNVPDTIVTNNLNRAQAFFKSHNTVCAKTLDKPSFKAGEFNYIPIYTKIVDADEFKLISNSLHVSPTIFQEFIVKDCDIRVVIIGSSINAFAIYPKQNSKAEVDFRHGFSEGLQYKIIELPNNVINKIRSFVELQGLVFSAIDMILDKDGTYWFLENNPNGQWLWLEFATKYPLTKIMSKYLSPDK